jgi:hypothetical protein
MSISKGTGRGYIHLLTPLLEKYAKDDWHEDAVGDYNSWYQDDIFKIIIEYERLRK